MWMKVLGKVFACAYWSRATAVVVQCEEMLRQKDWRSVFERQVQALCRAGHTEMREVEKRTQHERQKGK
jgi:hypothetical protein